MIEKNGMRSTRPIPSTSAPRKTKISALRPFAPEKMTKSRTNSRSGMRIGLEGAWVTSRLIQNVQQTVINDLRFIHFIVNQNQTLPLAFGDLNNFVRFRKDSDFERLHSRVADDCAIALGF